MKNKVFYLGALTTCLVSFWSLPLKAQEQPPAPPVDKSHYTVFDPTPDADMRSFCTDRPTKSNSPCTVDAGHWQYEADAFNWTYSNHSGTTQDTYLFTNPTVKLGLTNRIDLELNMAPVETVTTRNNATRQKTTLTGVGDLYTRLKYNLIGDDGGNFAATLLPYVKIPTAKNGIGNKAVEEGLIVPLAFTLPQGFTLTFDPEGDVFKNSNNTQDHFNYQGLANVSHTIFSPSVTGYAEIWGDVNNDPAGKITQSSFDLAFTWAAKPTLQFDIGANIGLNDQTPNLQSYIGISQRF